MSNETVVDETMVDIKNEDVIEFLNGIFNRPVLIPIPFAAKGPKRKEWNKVRWLDTQKREYKQEIDRAVQRGGNLGIMLGPPSGNLVTIDLDSDEEMAYFLEWAPWARNTYRTVGSKGCQCWFIMEGRYPNKREVWKTIDKKTLIEFRGDLQSVTWGKHPDTGGRYKNNGLKPLHISYLDLQEYYIYLREQGQGAEYNEEEYRTGQEGDFEWTKKYKGCNLRELDLIKLSKAHGVRGIEIEGEEGINKYAITCPWIDEHVSSNGARDAAIHQFEPRGQWWPAFTCFHSHCANRGLKDYLDWLDVPPSTLRKYCGEQETRQRIEIADCSDLIEAPPLPESIIDGLLYPELKMLIASASKIGKTWLGIDLGLSLANGSRWLGFDTCQVNVLYLNLEMPIPWFYKRICDIKRVKGIEELPKGSFKVANLRGSNALEGNLDALHEVCEKEGPFGVIIYDPVYKLLGDLDENKATDVAKLLGMVDAIGKRTSVASVLVHHYSKGDAWQKKIGDRASGSGVFLRDPDTYIAITELGEEDSGTARVDCRLRCSRPITSFGIRWENYQWRRDDTIDIKKKPNRGKNKEESKEPTVVDKVLQVLKNNPKGLTYTDWKNMVVVYNITTAKSFENVVVKLRNSKLIKQVDKLYFAI